MKVTVKLSEQVDWDKLYKLYANKVSQSYRQAAKDFFKQVVQDTPTGNPSLWKYNAPNDYTPGSLKNAWQLWIDNSKIKQSGVSGYNKIATSIKSVITLYNPLPYAQRVEYGWSSQAPSGMLRKNAKMFQKTFLNNIKKKIK